jgi:cytochrome c-type biogenesis protein CcmI
MVLALGALLVTAVVVVFVLHPIITEAQAPLERQEDEPTEAEMRKTVALKALRDAEYEHAMGKLDDADYQSLRSELSQEALDALRAEEATGAAAGPGRGEDEELEAEIASVRAKLKDAPECGSCGEENDPGARFCSECGRPLDGSAG